MIRTAMASLAAGTALFLAQQAVAAPPISVRDTFRIGTEGVVLCSAQSLATDAALVDMFDRGYSVVCRDAAVPVGRIYALRLRGSDPAQRLADLRAQNALCGQAATQQVDGLGAVAVSECRLKDADVRYRAYEVRQGNTIYVAEGLAGYDSALQLGLRTVVADRSVSGEVSVATTGAGDPAAFARVQAGTLDSSRALAEAYRRNNAGSYAESAEFFATVRSGQGDQEAQAEALVNEALQKSNLGRYAEADSLFGRASNRVSNDPLIARQLRNYRAMHLLNQGRATAAIAELDKPLPQSATLQNGAIADLVIDEATAARLNAEMPVSRQLGVGSTSLLPQEKAQILDGQALQLRGTALRLNGNAAGAAAALAGADGQLASIRSGRVSSVVWMRAQIFGDLAAIAETSGNMAEADRQYRASVAMIERDYPGSAALLSARGRLAGYLARSGQTEPALALYREVVKSHSENTSHPPSLGRLLTPYLELLLARQNDPQAMSDLFEATQILLRPGIAQTQAVLARELTGGSDEASRLFRQSVTLTRQIERSRIELARLGAVKEPTPAEAARNAALANALKELEKEQVETQAKLADFPRFRAVSTATISLSELQKQLRPGEAYYKMTAVGDALYGVFATADSARATRLGMTTSQLDTQVESLRETIATPENGTIMTYAYDVGLAHELYKNLFVPFERELGAVRHLVFEPDGGMLRLPPNLLVMNAADVAMIKGRAATGGDAEFDFTGVSWLGRERDISTSVSARAFRDVRAAPRATGAKQYLGLGDNTPVAASAVSEAATRDVADLDCVLSMTNWNRPISADELQMARAILAPNDPNQAEVLTRDAFTDTAIKQRSDLDEFRIIHFATHGIVTSPRRKCPAQPALMTSFGGDGSDGLLTFREIFDLRLDADIVILSACDTAAKASTLATRDAGLATGGDVALDGLVRAFVGAGGRLVIASHWPVPDEYDATKRLISGLFTAPAGTPTAGALRLAQQTLMDDKATSHPFYWSGFAAIGDAAAPVIRKPEQVAQLAK
ncbi:MAG: CHAT domain-containing protein [Pseudomonadota bacterium]|nr:CHAT domain-containing protein [Pseudomonadota bacterium]